MLLVVDYSSSFGISNRFSVVILLFIDYADFCVPITRFAVQVVAADALNEWFVFSLPPHSNFDLFFDLREKLMKGALEVAIYSAAFRARHSRRIRKMREVCPALRISAKVTAHASPDV